MLRFISGITLAAAMFWAAPVIAQEGEEPEEPQEEPGFEETPEEPGGMEEEPPPQEEPEPDFEGPPPEEMPPGEEPPPPTPPPTPPPVDPKAPPKEPDPPPVDPEAAAAEKAEKLEAERIAKEKQILANIASFVERMRKDIPEDERVKLITDLSIYKIEPAAEALVPWAEYKVPLKVRSTAIEALKQMPFPCVGSAASRYFQDKEATDISYSRQMISLMGRSKDKRQLSRLRMLMKDKKSNIEYAKAATIALGELGSPEAIPDLITFYQYFENPKLPPTEASRKMALENLVDAALQKLTGQVFMDSKGWAQWWKINESTFGKAEESTEAPAR